MAFDDDLRIMCANQYGIAGRRQLRAMGGTRTRIAHRVSKGILRPITAEVLELVGSPPSDGKRALAAVLDAPPGAILSHTSAAAWWDFPGSVSATNSMSRFLAKVPRPAGAYR